MNLKNQFIVKALQSTALILLLILNGFVLNFILKFELFKEKKEFIDEICKSKLENLDFGFDNRYFEIQKNKLKKNQLLPEILSLQGISNSISNAAIANISQIHNIKNLRAGNTYAFIHSNTCQTPDYFAYEIDQTKFVLCELKKDACAEVIERESYSKEEIATGTIETSLWDALEKNGVSLNIIDQMEDALSSSVDFHHVQKGNSFKLIFDRLYIGSTPTSSGNLIAAQFSTDNNESYAYSFIHNGKQDFYDNEGRPMRKSFLKAPVRFSRISSPFSSNRFHPVLRFSRPHLGTDYAAPTGTPIMAVGAGIVESASYTGGNGKFVKIRHDKMYQTQYLHMSRFAAGINPGAHVAHGQIIGYVGSTGLASGPHVCFRFWKNGVQVDHRKLSFPSPDPLPKEILPEFFKHRDLLKLKLDEAQHTAYISSTHPEAL
ncbi:MAG: M23 family metallopeptidase [Saprospiraceae bacterium]|nr:M23 family metallopeptidase [Saprospiraceae bacterium]